MSAPEDELVLGGRYQVMPAANVPARDDEPVLSFVILDVWDGGRKAVATVRLLPDEARELARRLVEAAEMAARR